MKSNPLRAGMRYTAGVRYGDPIATPAALMHARPPHKAAQIAPPPAPVTPAAPVVRKFNTFAEYLRAVVAAASGERVDTRLQRAPSGLSEGTPADGGFLVPQVWADELIGSIYKTGQIAGRCDRKTASTPLADVELPAVDETSRASGSRWGGVLAYWAAEAASISSAFPKWRRVGFSGNKIIGIGYATAEMFADGALFEAGLREAFSQEISFLLDDAILVGSGAGQPAGVVSAPCTISVAKETGQAAATIVAANITNMYDRLVADCLPNACWLINPDCSPQLRNLALVVGAAGAPLWSWNQDASPYPRLLGLPVIQNEHSAALGTVGDVVLADLSQYRIVDQAPKDAVSFDAAFVSDQVIFRMTYRADGKPKYANAITPANSSTTRSPFIMLATRS
jgi:HK97 family phage major capsid protein